MAFGVPEWSGFLREWDREAMEVLARMPGSWHDAQAREALAQGTILRAPATDADLDRAQAKLGATLPASVTRFFRASNGLTIIGFDAQTAAIWPLDQLCLLRDGIPDLVSEYVAMGRRPPDGEYFRYGPGQSVVSLRSEYFPSLVQLSEWVDAAVLLLNPMVSAEGEWEAWFYGSALPGARRYRSFEDLMTDLRGRSLRNIRAAMER